MFSKKNVKQFHAGYEEADIEELRLNEGKELLYDLKDSICKGRSLDLQDENGATAVRTTVVCSIL